MSLKDYLPRAIKDHVKLLKTKRRYPERFIDSSYIENGVILGEKCGISKNVELRKGVSLGNYSYINQGTIIASGEIGKFTSIGFNCQIGMFEHPIDHMSTSPYIYQAWRSVLNIAEDNWNEITMPTKIGNDVWIGSNVVIKQGVTIGDGAIVGAGSVVVKDVESFTIVGGVPAKKIRNRFSKEQAELLKELRWWDKDIDEIKLMKNQFLLKNNWHTYNQDIFS